MDGRIDLERARREAKALLRAARAGEAAALRRLAGGRRVAAGEVRLADAQLAVARELGYSSWPALVRSSDAERALTVGDVAFVRAWVADDPAVVRRPVGSRGWLPLLYVTYSQSFGDGSVECARVLLDAGADPDASWPHPERGPQWALNGAIGEPRLVEALLRAGATVGRTGALPRAIDRGDTPVVELLLSHDASAGERNMALLHAVERGSPLALIRLLIEHGASVAALDADGFEPYAVAVRRGQPDVAALLVSEGAAAVAEPVDELLGACFAGDRERARRLARDAPEAAALVRTARAGALVEAAGEGRLAAVEILLDLGVPVDARGAGGETALNAALRVGSAEVAALLRARGADARKQPPAAAPEPDPVDFGELGVAMLAAYLRHLATSPEAEVRPCGDGFAVLTGVESNIENGVVCDTLDGEVEEALAWFRGVPAQWITASAELGARLVQAGCTAERTAVVMGAEIRRAGRARERLEIAPVRDRAGLERWLDVAEAAEVAGGERRPAVWESFGFAEGRPLRHVIALRDGVPVGVAYAFVWEDTVELLELGVVPTARRQGIGRELALRVLDGSGCRWAVVAPTPWTVPFWRLLGFVLRPWPADRTYLPPAVRRPRRTGTFGRADDLALLPQGVGRRP